MMATQNGDYPNWQLELEEWGQMEDAERRARPFQPDKTVAEENRPKAKLSSLLKFAKAARLRPEIWNQILGYADKERNGEIITQKMWIDFAHLLGSFCQWYRRKNSITEEPAGYTIVGDLLWSWAKGDFGEEDRLAARRVLNNPLVDDDLQ